MIFAMTTDEIIKILLKNRGLTNPEQVEGFFHPPHPADIPLKSVGLKSVDIQKAITLIRRHIRENHKIFIYGDYDVDGLCAAAILWETLYRTYRNVHPHIPHRREEGYGLSQKGIDHCLSLGAKLIITVDNGIVASDQIDYTKKHNCDVIVVDHHEKGKKLPPADVILHSTSTCAAGLAYFFAKELIKILPSPNLGEGSREEYKEVLDLVSLAVICDIVPLLGVNRSFAKFGLEELNHTCRPGLLALIEISGIKKFPSPDPGEGSRERLTEFGINSYHVGFILGPRLNAAGRLEHALDSLRLLCTTDPGRARQIAQQLNNTNIRRQDLTTKSFDHAIKNISKITDLLVASSPDYDEGIIGLIAAKLVEKYYRPAIAISVGEEVSKASARSVPGFHITEYLHTHSRWFTSVGGHSMAAGFSFSTSNLNLVLKSLSEARMSNPDVLVKKSRIDAEINLSVLDLDFYLRLLEFAPFGLGNPQPVFSTPDLEIVSSRIVGKTGRHLKFILSDGTVSLPAIWFSPPEDFDPQKITRISPYYSLQVDSFSGRPTLQLQIKGLVK